MTARRKKLVAGNWKMHQTLAQAHALATAVGQRADTLDQVELIVFPPYTALTTVREALQGSRVMVGAQDMYFAERGAFTGAIGPELLTDAGACSVLVGHSERRALFGETLQTSRLRLQMALQAQLSPILCVGETLAERRAEMTAATVLAQLQAAVGELDPAALMQVIVAYEPVWAIGTGQVATGQQAQAVHRLIRDQVRRQCPAAADQMRILYGGSVKAQNAAQLFAQPDIDGALVGGASLDADSFVAIAQAACNAALGMGSPG